jgi:tetratricopeptide (TPR) repeat protein
MALRPLCVWLAWACLGCQGLVPLEPPAEQDSATLWWEKGQEAMRCGQPEQAVSFYERSLQLDPQLARNHLSLAAAYLERGDDESACGQLKRYVCLHPDQLAMRIHLADLQLRLRRLLDARLEFERCVAGAQDQVEPAYGQLIHCHARLMEIAEALEDTYDEHLHRGIGLSLLARQRAQLPDPEGDLSTESLLCKSAAELTLAHLDRADEARPNWYLSEVWRMLDQRESAQRCLRLAAAAAPFSELTGAEKRSLQLQCQCQAAQPRGK